MGKTKRSVESLYLDHDKLDLLKKLAEDSGIPRSVLLRTAVDDLLRKHKVLKPRKFKP
jgi:hypothetical protein